MSPENSYLDSVSAQKPESFDEEHFVPVKNARMKKTLPFLLILLLITVSAAIIINKKTTLPDMTDWDESQVQSWIDRTHKNTKLEAVFDLKIPAGHYVSQSIEKGEKISKKTPLTIYLSSGPDPNEAISVPDLRSLSLAQLKEWIETNKLTNTVIRYESHSSLPKDQLIDFEFVDGSAQSFMRKNRLNIYISNGQKEAQTVVSLPDFIGKNVSEVLSWAEKNKVQVIINRVFNATVANNVVVSQSIAKETKMNISDELIVEISRGKEIIVPDFQTFSRQEAQELASLLGLKVFFKYVDSESAEESVISQSEAPQTSVDESQIVTLHLSKKLTRHLVPDFIGLSVQEAKELAQLLNIKLFVKNSPNNGETKIISQSHGKDLMISEDTVVTLEVDPNSLLIKVPDFFNMSRIDAEILAENIGLKLSFTEHNATTKANNTVIGQSVGATERVNKGTVIKLDVIVNSGVYVPDLTTMGKNEVEVWAQKNGVSVKIYDKYSETHARGTLFDPSIKNKVLLKNEPVVIYYSLGRLHVPDFLGKSKEEVINWADDVNLKGAKIRTKFNLDYSSNKPRGSITYQSHFNETIALDKELTFNVSAVQNQGVQVPDFSGYSMSSFISWCQQNSILYSLTPRYSDVHAKDTVFDLSHKNTYLSKDSIITASQSLGKVYIPDFTGKLKSEVTLWLNDVNTKGANIKVTYTTQASTDPKDTVLSQTLKDAFADLSSNVQITLSDGP